MDRGTTEGLFWLAVALMILAGAWEFWWLAPVGIALYAILLVFGKS